MAVKVYSFSAAMIGLIITEATFFIIDYQLSNLAKLQKCVVFGIK